MQTFISWLLANDLLGENSTRYSVEVNFRSKISEVLENYARIALGYVSAALKASDCHVKQVFDDGLLRILVSSRNWDDGEWVVVVSWNPHHNAFFISRGLYNKMTKNVSIKKDSSEQFNPSHSPSEVAQHVKNLLHHLKTQKDGHAEKLKKVPLKTGPKKRV